MNLRDALLKEHSKSQCNRIVNFVGDDPKRFKQLVSLFFDPEYRVAQRAAWPVSYSVKNHPELIKPYFRRLLGNLSNRNVHDAVIRNTVRLFQYVSVPERYHGALMNSCFDFIQSNDIPVAIKAFSITVLSNLSKKYPDILPELKLVLAERWPHESAAFRSRAKPILYP